MRRQHLLAATLLALAGRWALAADAGQAQREDLDWVAQHYVAASHALAPEARAAALQYIGQLRQQGGSLNQPAFIAALLRISAMADNAHDYLDFGDGAFPDTRLPLRLAWFADGLVVSRAAPAYLDLLGARVERIAGLAPDALSQRLRQYFGGPANYVQWNANWAIEAGGMLHAFGIAREAHQLRLALRLRDGSRAELDVPYLPHSGMPAVFGHASLLASQPNADEQRLGWRSAVRASAEPLYLQQPQQLFRLLELAPGMLYVQLRTNVEQPDGSLAAFAASLQQRLAHTPPDYLVMDLRLNSGGNSDLTRALASAIGQQVRRKVYVLTGPRTFSAGIVNVAAIKRDATVPVAIVGEPVGDRMRWWSEGSNTTLPHTRYQLHRTSGLWDLAKGCAGEAHCYGDKLQANAGSLEPDIAAPLTAAAWLRGIDPALDAVWRDVRGQP